ncbi:sugar kinase [Lewinella sp. LCG006]|uniref:sugar kinase n=1 Tax=Lewinella sp. LCG006 TaxID=3231911 RepID=UPI003460033C
MSYEYALIVKNKTRMEQLIERFNTKAQARFYLERNGGDFDEYELEHLNFQHALSEVQRQLAGVLKYKLLDRSFLPGYLFAKQHLIITVGQDGLVANTAKYAGSCPILAVNPDVDRYDGVLLPYTVNNFLSGVRRILRDDFPVEEVSLAEARLQDGQRLLAFNELFIGASSHVSARYEIAMGQQQEVHSSSGLLVSTRAGSTAWLSSVFNMVQRVPAIFGAPTGFQPPQVAANELIFAVREPFASKQTQINMVAGKLGEQQHLQLSSLMPSQGVIFSDGIEQDFLQFNSGAVATIGVAPEKAMLVQQ